MAQQNMLECATKKSYFSMDGCILSTCRPTTRIWEIHISGSAQVPIFPDKKCSTSMPVVTFIFPKICKVACASDTCKM
jgi:hypothetical protein